MKKKCPVFGYCFKYMFQYMLMTNMIHVYYILLRLSNSVKNIPTQYLTLSWIRFELCSARVYSIDFATLAAATHSSRSMMPLTFNILTDNQIHVSFAPIVYVIAYIIHNN